MIQAIPYPYNTRLGAAVVRHPRLAVVVVVALAALGIAAAVQHYSQQAHAAGAGLPAPLAAGAGHQPAAAAAPILPICDVRQFLERPVVDDPVAPLIPTARLYRDSASLLTDQLDLPALAALALTNRGWHARVQPRINEIVPFHDRVVYELENAPGQALAVKTVFFDRVTRQFMFFNSLNGYHPTVVELGTITIQAGIPRVIAIGAQQVSIVRPQTITFTQNRQVDEEALQEAVTEFNKQCRRIKRQ